jgi:hypothetical protein
MCMQEVLLTKIDSKGNVASKNEESRFYGYKAFVPVARGWAYDQGWGLYDWNTGKIKYPSNKWIKSDEAVLSDDGCYKKYTSGFHIFVSLADLKDYLDVHPTQVRVVLHKIEFKDIVALGNQQGKSRSSICIIAKQMKILEEVK